MTPPDLQDDGIPTLTKRIDAAPLYPAGVSAPAERTRVPVDQPSGSYMARAETAHAMLEATARSAPWEAADRSPPGPEQAVLRATLQAAVEQAVDSAIDEATVLLKARLEAELPEIVARVLRSTRSG